MAKGKSKGGGRKTQGGPHTYAVAVAAGIACLVAIFIGLSGGEEPELSVAQKIANYVSLFLCT
jgi:hypothetical protein